MPEAKKERPKSEPESHKIHDEPKTLYRSTEDKVIAGVSGGLAEYFNFDSTIIRILFVLLAIFGGSGFIIYIVLWLIVPSKSDISKNSADTIRSNLEDMKSKTQSFAHDIGRPGITDNNHRFWWAIFIIILGFVFLMKNFGLLESIDLDKFWPLILIIIGLAIILRK